MRWDAGCYGKHAAFVADLALPVVELLAPRAGERMVDLGCGDGRLSRRLVEAGVSVVGLEPDPAMADAARARGIEVVLGDASDPAAWARLGGGFDAVFSNAALHWIVDQQAVLTGVAGALRPGGRFVGECGGPGNLAAIRAALRAVLARRGADPERLGGQNYPTQEGFCRMAGRAGLVRVETSILHRPTPLATGLGAWIETFRGGLFERLELDDLQGLIDEVEAVLRPILWSAEGGWWADYVRLRWRAWKPEDA